LRGLELLSAYGKSRNYSTLCANLSSRFQLHVIQHIDDLKHIRLSEEAANALIAQIGER
jgi:hypothetical protein